MMKGPVIIFFLSICFCKLAAQAIEIKGRVTDTAQQSLELASVLLLDATDSSYISFTQTDRAGRFTLSQKIKIPFIIKVSYLGYFPYEIRLDPSSGNLFDLGTIPLKPINQILFEVVIKEAKAPLKMRGDTIEYDATTFKVPAGSSVEDLLRKLPGIQVDADGSISSQGQSVNKLTVDGKRFFGEDPTMATKNLPAESVSKVQVFNEKTEQEKLTGLSLEKDQKTMNLELKEDFKKGGFGKILAGLGIEQREDFITGEKTEPSKWELKGNYNKFNKKEQFSLIAVQNNTGRNGMNWNDYQDFRGQQSWEWNTAEELFNFSSAFRYYYMSSDENSDDFGGAEAYFGDESAGIPKNSQAGFNYNYDQPRLKYTANYSFKQNNLFSRAIRNRQFFLPDNQYSTDDESQLDRKNASHRAEFILEKEIDSLHSFIFKLRGNGIFTDQNSTGLFLNNSSEEILTSKLSQSRNSDRQNLGWQSVVFFKKKFKNKRRNLGFNAIFNQNDRENNEDLYSSTSFYENGMVLTDSLLEQDIAFNTTIQSFKTSALYVEPLPHDFALQFIGNFIRRSDLLDRSVFDKKPDTLLLNPDYSYQNDHKFQLLKFGSLLQYGKSGFNISGGLAIQSIDLNGQFKEGLVPLTKINRAYTDFLETFSINYQLPGNKRLGFNYSKNVQEPSFKNLSPIVDNSNPFFIRIGNPELDPEVSRQMSANFGGNNQIKFTNYNINMNYTYFENQHVTEQTTDSFLVSTTRVVNYKGGQRLGTYMGYGFPIIKNRLTLRLNLNYNYNLSKSIINSVLNNANINNGGLSLNVSWTPNDRYSIYFDSRFNVSNTSYSIQTGQNYQVFSQIYNAQVNGQLLWGLYSNLTLDYRNYQNDQFAFQYAIPILNASIYKLLLKSKRMELRLSAYDLLNKNISIQQFTNFNQVTDTRTYLLSRYFMLSLSYNMKGITASVKRANDWMH